MSLDQVTHFQIKPNFTFKKPNLFIGDDQKCGEKTSDFITCIKLVENYQNGEFKWEIVER